MKEEWKDVAGYEGLYQASDMGRVKSFYHDTVHGRILKPQKASNGYLQVMLYQDGEHQIKLIHRLVAEAFLGPQPSPDYEVNHKNGDRTDNRVENLEWVTHLENVRHAIEDLGKGWIGEAHGNAKLMRDDVKKIRKLYATGQYMYKDIGEMFGVTRENVGDIIRGNTWQHVDGPVAPKIDHQVRGETNASAKLARNDVRKIRRLYATGEYSYQALGRMFGVSNVTIGQIVRRETWKHIS